MSLITVNGGNHIQAELLAYTKGVYSPIATFRVRFHRYVAEQFLKHRMFSCNAISSRAMSVPKMNARIDKYPAIPLFWGAQEKGMQPNQECNNKIEDVWLPGNYDQVNLSREDAWDEMRNSFCLWAEDYWDADYHQQIPNRLTHPFQMTEYIVTSTDWSNSFNLRLHDDGAQAEINELARCMEACLDDVEPQ